jgi:glyoxylase-like metal-dependent hydrolase (beta-lactamase superfamily II)
LNHDLAVIDLDQPKKGYTRFLSTWLCRGDGLAFIVDPGPRSTIQHLVAELSKLGVSHLDFVLLTHIHLDHGGGSAEILDAFPGAKLYCHPKGTKHLFEPAMLWNGSLKVLGDDATMYGEPRPVDPVRMTDEAELARHGIEAIATPGHAVHHASFRCGTTFFAGEAFGTRSPLPSGALYLRPATPPRFYLEQALGSIDRILAMPEEPSQTAFAHYGLVPGCFELARAAREQLLLWVGAASELRGRAASRAELDEIVFQRLQKIDPHYGLGLFDELDADIQARERHFLHNTLDGILGWLEASA